MNEHSGSGTRFYRGKVSPVLFSLYVNDMPVLSHHVELAPYANDTAVIATSCKPALLVSYLEAYLADLRALAEEMEDRHQRLEEHGDALHSQAYPESLSSLTVRGTNSVGRYSPLSGCNP